MLSLNCKNCGKCCTSRERELFVFLLPREKNKYENFSTKLKIKNYKFTILKKDRFGNCIFYDTKKKICKIYKSRPFECRAYPLLIHFTDKITFKIDKNVCPKINDCCLKEVEETKKRLLNHNLSLDWIKAYSTIE